ncbi:MAG TPA: phage terminase large subunit [Rhizomicrobium sp.]|jgi:predicted phage terminase large subunit-like protein|nr:phage terminase large subunit [Rhizomicrobium sp.]
MSDRTLTQYKDILRRDFTAFSHRAFRELNGATPYLGNWHLDVMAAKLEAVRRGELTRLAIALPPRHLKSHMVSIAFAAFVLGHDPARQIICASYAQDLADKLSRDCRALMGASFYRALFDTNFAPDKQAVGEFATTKGGFRLATSIGGVLTGRGADLIIIDDPLKAEEAWSDARRNAVNEWFDTALLSRLNDKTRGAIVIVMQRLHEDDLIGHVTAKGGWDLLAFPAIAEEDQSFAIDTPYGPRTFARKTGEVLHPLRESADTLARMRAQMGSAAFLAQYQQAPCPREGVMVKVKWFPRYEPHQRPRDFEEIVISCDTANKASELSDYTVFTVWGVKDRHLWLLSLLRRRMEYYELKRTLKELIAEHRARVVLIEDRASGTQLAQELTWENVHGVKACQPVGDKQVRLWAQCATIEQGFVHLPREAPWLGEYLRELTSFPNSKHDDQVDSTTQAIAWLTERARNPMEPWFAQARAAGCRL